MSIKTIKDLGIGALPDKWREILEGKRPPEPATFATEAEYWTACCAIPRDDDNPNPGYEAREALSKAFNDYEEVLIETPIRDYNEGFDVSIRVMNNRLIIKAINEGGFGATYVDLLDVIDWLKANAPALLKDR